MKKTGGRKSRDTVKKGGIYGCVEKSFGHLYKETNMEIEMNYLNRLDFMKLL